MPASARAPPVALAPPATASARAASPRPAQIAASAIQSARARVRPASMAPRVRCVCILYALSINLVAEYFFILSLSFYRELCGFNRNMCVRARLVFMAPRVSALPPAMEKGSQ
jgi:hypothetical protein